MDNIKKFEDFLDKMQKLLDNAKKQGHIIVRIEDLENAFPELKESEDEKKPNGAIVMENFDEGDGFYKVNLAYLNKKQVEDIEKFVEKWNEAEDERIRKAIICGMNALKDQKKETFAAIPIDDCIVWLENQNNIRKQIKNKVYSDIMKRMHELKDKADIPSDYDIVIHNMNIESEEDEKIRKTIEKALKGECCLSADETNRCLAWLENQGEQESIDDLTPQKAMDIAVAKCFEQGEQKPADKVEPIEWSGKINSRNAKGVLKEMLDKKLKSADNTEPKFKSGDWITNGDYTWKIVEVEPLDYVLQSQDGNIVDDTISHVDEQFHSFTIQDAKAGDVLVSQYNKPFIYNGNLDSFLIGSYCGISTEGKFNVATEKCRWAGNVNIHPATKEQRNLLFQKMKEAGYEWDAVKKELKKIEQKSADEEMKEALRTEYEKGRADVIAEIQKSAWSEEDEKMISDIATYLNRYGNYILNKNEEKAAKIYKSADWLKSIRPQNRWKPSDEQIRYLQAVVNEPKNAGAESCHNALAKLLGQLKNIVI